MRRIVSKANNIKEIVIRHLEQCSFYPLKPPKEFISFMKNIF